MLTLTDLLLDAVLGALTLKTTQRVVEGLAFFDNNGCHILLSPLPA